MSTESVVDVLSSENVSSLNREGGLGKFIRDVLFSNLPLPFQKLRTYLWMVFFSRAFGPSGFGVWSLFITTLGLALILTTMTQGNAMMRFLGANRSQEDNNRVFSSVLAAVSMSSLSVALAFAIFSAHFSNLLFRDYRGQIVFLLVALIVPLETYFEMMRGLLRARRLNRSWAFFTMSRVVPETAVLIAVVWWWRRDPVAAITGYLVIAALSVLIGLFYLARCQHTRIVRPSVAVMSQYVPYGLAIIPGALISSLSFAADRYLVNYYLDLRQVGIYSVCYNISALGFFFVGPLNDVLFPEMATLHDAGDWEQFYNRFSGVQKVVTGLAVGATALLIAFPQQILQALSTRDFTSGGATLAILGLQGIFMSIVMLYMVMLYVRLRLWLTTIVWTVMAITTLIIDVVLLPRSGIIGAGFGQLISSVVGAVLVLGLNWEVFRRTFRFVWVPQTGAALLGVWLLGRHWNGSTASVNESLEQIGLGAIVFVFGLFVTRYLRASEFIALRETLWPDAS
jgi:O-antigen/teichoic acid export membrane protein